MNIIVCIKQTFDTEARISLNPEGLIEESQVKFILNPFDEYAVEEAIRLTETDSGHVTAVSAGFKDPSQALRQCLAIGVDHAVWLDCKEINDADPYIYAEVLSRWLKGQDYDLIFCGKEAIDDAASEVPARLAEALDLPQINAVSSLSIDDGKITARRDIEGGSEIIKVALPCLLSAQKGLNDPRYPSMRRIMLARKMKVETITLEELDLSPEELKPITHVEGYVIPPPRQGGRVLSGNHEESVAELITILKEERKIF